MVSLRGKDTEKVSLKYLVGLLVVEEVQGDEDGEHFPHVRPVRLPRRRGELC